MDVWMKSTYYALPLIALLPCPKYLNLKKSLHGVMKNRLIHHCLDIICQPLKVASANGAFMSDSLGCVRLCFTPVVAYIVDTPEAAAIAGVGGKTSHLTLASHKTYGDDFHHPACLGSLTLAQIQYLTEETNPWDLEQYAKAAQKRYQLNGVHLPFWWNWALPDGSIVKPSQFLTPEPLHHWHKQFWDHDAKWCIRAVGGQEIDFCFSLLQPCIGFRYFKARISSLKQVTGRDHCNVQHYIVPIIADAVPKKFILCIRALSNFCYLGQSRSIDDRTLAEISNTLDDFHKNKYTILDAGARVGKGNKPLNNFFIPKLKLFHSIVTSICWSGVPVQWSADSTERAHINVIKTPSENTNNGEYGPQICRNLDHNEKRRLFDLATAICEARDDCLDSICYGSGSNQDDEEAEEKEPNEDWVRELDTVETACGPSWKPVNLFMVAEDLMHSRLDGTLHVPQPLHTFVTSLVAFNLSCTPDISQVSVDSLAEQYNLPDLRTALLNFLSEYLQNSSTHQIGGHRRTQPNLSLPFDDVMVWSSICTQTRLMDDRSFADPRPLNAMPPSDMWPLGWYDTALFISDSVDVSTSPDIGLNGKYFNQCHIFNTL